MEKEEKKYILNGKHGSNYDSQKTNKIPASFEITPGELQNILRLSGKDATQKIEEHFGDIDKLCWLLKTDKISGLPKNDDFDERRKFFGGNKMNSKHSKSFLVHLWDAFKDHTLIILIIAAIVSIGLSFYQAPDSASNDDKTGIIEGVGILIAVVIIVFVTAAINANKEAQFRGLQSKLSQQFRCDVVRNSETVNLPVGDILVGDVCHLKYGDAIPADGIIISSNDLKLDESSHTGESEEIAKSSLKDPILYSGTHIMEGTAKMLVCAVGERSQKGIIFSLLSFDGEDEDNSSSLLRNKLNKIAYYITIAGTIISLTTFVILMTRFCIQKFAVEKMPWNGVYVEDFIRFLIISITLLVVAIPEGLPLAVILSLAYSIRKMMLDNNLVRHLDSCETMGSATIICSDKTGTLTTNKMSVVDCYVADEFGMSDVTLSNLPNDLKKLLAFCISLNTGYHSHIAIDGYGQIGNKTECALLNFVTFLGEDYAEMRRRHPEESFRKIFSFNSQRKWMATVAKFDLEAGRKAASKYNLFVKGAPEVVVERCGWIRLKDALPIKLSGEARDMLISKVVEPMAKHGLRTICVAYKEILVTDSVVHESVRAINEDYNWDDELNVVQDLTFLAVTGIEDPVRPEVPEAIMNCCRAGISVKMVTGDNLHTAKFVAQKCGLFVQDGEHLAITGSEFNKMIRQNNDDQGDIDQHLFDEVWPRLRVLARATPRDKYNLVSHLMLSQAHDRRQIVAVTGDGTNDGPALKKAHVGLCMGISGTDVAKEASDIILIDDNITSIVRSVVWGRHVNDSIVKFLQFQLSINFVAMLLTLIGACFIADTPIRGVQMLWVNLLIDSLASLSLATEPPSENLLDRRPNNPDDFLITPLIGINIAASAAYQIIVLLVILFAGESLIDFNETLPGHPTQHFTFIFNTFVLMILFNEINSRKIDSSINIFSGILHSPIFICIWIGSFVVQVLIVQFGGDVFFTYALTFDLWMWSLFFGLLQLIENQVVSFILRRTYLKKKNAEWDDVCAASRSSIYTPSLHRKSSDKIPLFNPKIGL